MDTTTKKTRKQSKTRKVEQTPKLKKGKNSELLANVAQALATANKVLALNQEYCYVQTINAVIHIPSGDRLLLSSMRERGGALEQWASHTYRSHRNSKRALIFEPNPAMAKADPDTFNLFDPRLMMQPSPKPKMLPKCPRNIRKLVFNVAGRKKRQARYIMQWLAWGIRNLGRGENVALILHGEDQGSGKGTLADIMALIYKRYYVVLDQHSIESQFNSILRGKIFVYANEVVSEYMTSKRAAANKLKTWVAGDRLVINGKGDQEFVIRNCMNFMFSSNSKTPLVIDPQDRRYSVIMTGGILDPALATSLWNDIHKSTEDPRWIQRFLDYLTYTVDLSDYVPNKPLDNADRRKVISNSLSEIATWVYEYTPAPGDYEINTLFSTFSEWNRQRGNKDMPLKWWSRDLPSSWKTFRKMSGARKATFIRIPEKRQ